MDHLCIYGDPAYPFSLHLQTESTVCSLNQSESTVLFTKKRHWNLAIFNIMHKCYKIIEVELKITEDILAIR